MTGLIIVLFILLFITLLLFVRVKIQIYDDDENLKLRLKILGIPFTLSPKKEKKIKIRLRDYSYKSMQKKERKAENARLKAELKKIKKTDTEKDSLSEKNSGFLPIIKMVISRFIKYLRTDITKIHIIVATDDAAKTAIMYGAAAQGVAALLDILKGIPNVKVGYKTDILVKADFLSDKTRADVDILFSIVVWQALATFLHTVLRYIKNQNKNK